MDEMALVNLLKDYCNYYKEYKRNRIWVKKIKRKEVVKFIDGLTEANGLLGAAFICSGSDKYRRVIDYIDKDFKWYKSAYKQLDKIIDILDSVV